ncbi:MAG: LacI family DNA-binding transcriptional regulator [Armatimonadota bacterium]|nr:LacI family transcriptional regulator [bacterium]MDW8320018.1 LacI family DNA-binding transcriptional regulator [Armatimonadota bacterium]
MEKRRITLKDIAMASQVSIATACDVLNNKPRTRVSETTRQRILETASRLGYQPHRGARSLRTNLHHLIAVSVLLAPEMPFSPFASELVSGAFKAAREEGWHITVSGYRDIQEELRQLEEIIAERSVDGVIIYEPVEDDPRISLLKGKMPFVLIGSYEKEEVYSVDLDNEGAAFMATQHLIALGHHHIALVSAPRHYLTCRSRQRGYRQALLQAGIPFDQSFVVEVEEYSSQAGAQALEILLQRNQPRPTAVVAMDDSLALGIIYKAHQHGLHVPDDLAVVGFNDARYTEYSEPSLTTVRVFAEAMARQATQMLIRLIRQEPVGARHIVMPAQMIIRRSCGSWKKGKSVFQNDAGSKGGY